MASVYLSYNQIIASRTYDFVRPARSVLHGQNGCTYLLVASKHDDGCFKILLIEMNYVFHLKKQENKVQSNVVVFNVENQPYG